jgi:hypothetical protein
VSSRTVAVVLKAQVDDYVSQMQAGAAAHHRRRESGPLRDRAVPLAFGAAAAVGIALVVKASAEYGAKMAQLQSLSHATTGR